MTARIHQPCGEQMTRAAFDHHARNPQYRSQPIWSCYRCEAWEPGEDWQGQLPNGWDGQRWTTQA